MARAWQGIKQRVEIRYNDGTEPLRVETNAQDAIKFEALEKKPVLGSILGLTDLLRMGWLAGRRTGHVESKDFAGWCTTVDDVDQWEPDPDDDLGPTP